MADIEYIFDSINLSNPYTCCIKSVIYIDGQYPLHILGHGETLSEAKAEADKQLARIQNRSYRHPVINTAKIGNIPHE